MSLPRIRINSRNPVGAQKEGAVKFFRDDGFGITATDHFFPSIAGPKMHPFKHVLSNLNGAFENVDFWRMPACLDGPGKWAHN